MGVDLGNHPPFMTRERKLLLVGVALLLIAFGFAMAASN